MSWLFHNLKGRIVGLYIYYASGVQGKEEDAAHSYNACGENGTPCTYATVGNKTQNKKNSGY